MRESERKMRERIGEIFRKRMRERVERGPESWCERVRKRGERRVMERVIRDIFNFFIWYLLKSFIPSLLRLDFDG